MHPKKYEYCAPYQALDRPDGPGNPRARRWEFQLRELRMNGYAVVETVVPKNQTREGAWELYWQMVSKLEREYWRKRQARSDYINQWQKDRRREKEERT